MDDQGHRTAEQRPYRSVIEIRVHGVSGTPPEDLLDRGAVRQVGGDATAGFYRPVHTDQLRDQAPGAPADSGPWLEGYCWSGWTSGGRLRAFWLFFLPFALINVAPRMLPAWDESETKKRGRSDLAGALLRLLALSLTFTFLIGVANATTYVIGTQCASPTNPCVGLPAAFTGWLSGLSMQARFLMASAVGLLFIFALWWLSRTASKYARGEAPVVPRNAVHPEDDVTPLARRDLWASYGRVRRLRRLHVQFAIVSVIGMVTLALPSSTMRWVALTAVAAVTVWSAVLVADRPNGAVDDAPPGLGLWLTRWAPSCLTVLLGVVAVLVSPDEAMPDATRVRDVFDNLVLVSFVLQAALLVVLLAVVWLESRSTTARSMPTMLGGRAAWHFAVLGWLVGSMFNAAVMVLTPVWLVSNGLTLSPATVIDVMNERRAWFGQTTYTAGAGMLFGVILIVVGVVLFALCAVFRRFVSTARDRTAFAADYPDLAADRDRDREREILFDFWLARRVDYAGVAVRWFVWPVTLFLVLQGVVLAVPSLPSWLRRLFGVVDGGADGSLPAAIGLGAYFTAMLLFVVIAIGLLSFRQRSTRKGVGVLWDLTCFWPRDVHPFAPPCYTERIVPEVGRRIEAYVRGSAQQQGDPGRVVLAAHSQGTVICVAALMAHVRHLPTPRGDVLVNRSQDWSILPSTALLTFGCVLDRLYARFFPRYFNRSLFAQLATELGDEQGRPQWTNLWRHSDFLGGSVPYSPDRDPWPTGSGPRNVRSVDPVFDMAPEDIVYPRAGRHSYFTMDPVFHRELGALIHRFGPTYADCVPGDPPDPPFPEAPRSTR